MKKIICATLLCLAVVATAAHADWIKNFSATYHSKNIDFAVIDALKEGTGPDLIVNEGLKIQGLNPQHLIKALYCAGVDGNDIKKAANAAGISDILIVAGYDESVAVCGDKLADTQAYTPATAAAPSFAGMPSPAASGGGASYASPSSF